MEVLVSAVLLGIFSSLGWQLQASIGRAAQQQSAVEATRRWLALQLQRDAGLLIRQGALLALDCSNKEQRRQGLLELKGLMEQAGSIKPAETFSTQRQLQLVDGLLALRVSAGEWQRQRDYSLEGLGACINELG